MSTANPSSTIVGSDSNTSTVSVEMATGWHVLRVDGYSSLKGLAGIGKHIESGKFSVGGYSWYIKFFPDGISDVSADSIGVGLYLDRPADDRNSIVKVRPTFSLLKQSREPELELFPGIEFSTWTLLSKSPSWGSYYCSIKRVELEPSSHLRGNSFQIMCDVTVFKEIRVESTTVESQTVPPLDVHRHLGNLLGSDIGGDVTFDVRGKTFPAHKYMLAARSSVFKAELFGPMKVKATDQIRIDDMEPRVFKAMLHIIYTDMLPEVCSGELRTVMHQHLLVAADRYNMERLKLICEDVLGKCIDTDIAATTLVLAEQHDCPGLKEACFRFLRRTGNLRTVMASDGFQHLKNSCPSLLEELLAKVAP